jgi:sec-independent protein translocase protein TatB
MSGIGFFELVILFLIGLIVLGPKRLHSVASQLGSWVGQARRMTRAMKRQLEDELDLGDDLKAVRNIASDIKGIKDDFVDELKIGPDAAYVPHEDDAYSPLHDKPDKAPAGKGVSSEAASEEAAAEETAAKDEKDQEEKPA